MVNSGKACLAPESLLGLDMIIPTEPIGSIPRPQKVITAFEQYERGSLSREEFESICSEAVRETIEKFEATGSPVITDGEQTKPSFAPCGLGVPGQYAAGLRAGERPKPPHAGQTLAGWTRLASAQSTCGRRRPDGSSGQVHPPLVFQQNGHSFHAARQ